MKNPFTFKRLFSFMKTAQEPMPQYVPKPNVEPDCDFASFQPQFLEYADGVCAFGKVLADGKFVMVTVRCEPERYEEFLREFRYRKTKPDLENAVIAT